MKKEKHTMQQTSLEEQQIDMTIQHIGETYQLGTPVLLHGEKISALYRRNRLYGLCLLVIAIIVMIGIGFYINNDDGSMLFIILASIITICAGLLLIFGYQKLFQRHQLFYLCPQGLLRFNVRRKQPEIVRWDQVDGVWYKYNEENTQYTMQRIDGTRFIFSTHELQANVYQQVEKTVERAMIHLKLPQAVNAYRTGYPVTFGQITVSQQGIQYKKRWYSWQEIKLIKMQADDLIIMLTASTLGVGQRKAINSKNVPNYCVLIALVNTITHHTPLQ